MKGDDRRGYGTRGKKSLYYDILKVLQLTRGEEERRGVQYSTVQLSAVLCYMQCCVVQYSAIQYSTVMCCHL